MARAYKRKIYLQDKPRKVAREELLSHFKPTKKTEWIHSSGALGRITAEPVYALNSMPHYHASAMDGIAVKAENTFSAHEQNPIQLKRNEDFIYVDTGNAVPSPYNAVIMIENVEELSEDVVEIIEPASPWQHIRPIGEDIVQEEMLFGQGHKIRPVDTGVLLGSQTTKIKVFKEPIVTVIPTGNELVSADDNPAPGKIIEFNGTVISNYIEEWGGKPLLHSIVRDEPEEIRNALLEASAASDIVIINAGSSAGSKDYTVHIIEELGEVFTHGVATRPGKPAILGKINDTVIVGIPGYSVSAYLALEWFVRPLICDYLEIPEPKRPVLKVKLGRRIVSTMGAEDFLRMNIGYVNGEYIANPLTRAAGVTMSLARADGLLIVPPDALGYEQGEYVELELYKPLEEIQSAVVFNGSHDLTIDILSSFLKNEQKDAKIISSHVGSMAGIMAIKKGEAHVAGIHLLDPETKEYNRSYVNRFLAGQDVVLYPFLKRKQGWLLPKGNPLGIENVEDIAKKKALYVNRQKGAGTRILFDLLLKENSINPDEIIGYEREMFSHLSVAAEVKGDEKAVGLGIYPAAKAMGLEFIPVADEDYDLLMTKSFFESDQGQKLLKIIHSEGFKKRVEAIGGYAVVSNPEPIIF
ncbi:molybdopterin biosynthesis protein [Bacillus dakarensis]|uniref:molybdopterin biosynthesis protein n=1 Tax=Robertmurraya dakarensis TaxID=1926278 RepID=UPI0009817753|nr:molybdopterin biosynthesis protein [Bacillus dakarensis]